MRLKIVQDPDSRTVYLRITGISTILRQPSFKISMGRKTLGPGGWGNEPHRIVSSEQRLSDGDLLLRLENVVVNYPDPGKPVQVEVPELDISEPLFWPTLKPSQNETEATRVSGESAFRFEREREREREAAPRPNPDENTAMPDGHSSTTEPPPTTTTASQGDAPDVGPQPPGPATPPETPNSSEQPADRVAPDQPTNHASERTAEAPPPTGSTGRRVLYYALAVVTFIVGAAAGSGTMYYLDREKLAEHDRLRSENAYLRGNAYAPLANVVAALPPRSPQGVDPVQKVNPLQPDRARRFWNLGSEARTAGQQPEAIYWYRQALKLCEADSMTYLADAYLHGETGSGGADPATGFQLMRCAAALGNDTARDTLSRLLKNGHIQYAPPELGDRYLRSR